MNDFLDNESVDYGRVDRNDMASNLFSGRVDKISRIYYVILSFRSFRRKIYALKF